MVSRVLVPMDDSEHAEDALKYAFENYPDAEITVLHVVGVPSMMMGDATALALEDDIEKAAAERAEPVFERANRLANDRDRNIETVVGIGHPAKNILNRAEKYDTIVLGAHGADWSRVSHRFLVGNVAETVSKRATVPVVLVR
ncbi:universal stress protein [Natranaeroarchaeum aerophilus]|uniref:Universal stress protein n=1 Tax=Natranaeroarchaeum aerophilus TaxID=2917711 RepID=A0AAE3K602_9EURY|nr:universal stress protein [Natranaeroarchaeum aerophilus]MCL9812264.1 universal stress protein [Natranaeroarchaeum aerophilus]